MAQAERVALEVEAVNLANQGGPAMAHGADKVAEAVALEVVPAEPVVAASAQCNSRASALPGATRSLAELRKKYHLIILI